MLLLSIFEIPYGERLAKNVQEQYVQVIPRSTFNPTRVPLKVFLIQLKVLSSYYVWILKIARLIPTSLFKYILKPMFNIFISS